MCGRFTLRTAAKDVARAFQLDLQPELAPRFNVAPGQGVPAVRVPQPGAPRELVPLRWGLVPFWADDPAIGNRLINARGETVDTKPAFRQAVRRRRCLVPADGYYEWQRRGRTKQPYWIRMPGGELFALAGLWERWERGGEALETLAVITAPATPRLAELHDRMPVIVAPQDYARWLDPDEQRVEAVRHVWSAEHGPADNLVFQPVSTRVNSPAHDDPGCIESFSQPGEDQAQRSLF